jgi:hypothetical protein
MGSSKNDHLAESRMSILAGDGPWGARSWGVSPNRMLPRRGFQTAIEEVRYPVRIESLFWNERLMAIAS